MIEEKNKKKFLFMIVMIVFCGMINEYSLMNDSNRDKRSSNISIIFYILNLFSLSVKLKKMSYNKHDYLLFF